MSRYIAFLRAINVGGGRTIKMVLLRQLFETLGFSNVSTFIASGNVIFETTKKSTKSIEKKIEQSLQKKLGYEVAAFVRTRAALVKIANYKAFPESKTIAADEFNILFLKSTLDKKLRQKVKGWKTDTNEFRIHGREIYWLRHKKQGKSTFSTVPFEKILGKTFTIRAAKTVKKIVTKYGLSKS